MKFKAGDKLRDKHYPGCNLVVEASTEGLYEDSYQVRYDDGEIVWLSCIVVENYYELDI